MLPVPASAQAEMEVAGHLDVFDALLYHLRGHTGVQKATIPAPRLAHSGFCLGGVFSSASPWAGAGQGPRM